MRLTYLFLFAIIFSFSYLQAQVVGGDEEKLAKLYNLGKYESCLYKAEDLTFKDDYKKDPEPYLYMAMCFYELSNSSDPSIQEDFKNGLKQAIKYSAKFAKYDKEGEMYEDNIEFIQILKDSQFAIIKDYFDEGNYRKAGSTSKNYGKLLREKDYSILYFRGVSEILSNNFSQGTRDLDEATVELNSRINNGKLRVDNTFKSLVSASILKYSEYLIKENQTKASLENLSLGKKMFPNDGYIEVQYNMIIKNQETKKDSTKIE